MFIPRNSLKRSLYKAIFEINHHKKMKKSATGTWRNISTKKMKAKFYLNISEKIIHRTICAGKLSTKQALHKSIFQTNSNRSLYQRIFEETCLPNIAWNESLPTKYLKRNLSPEYFSNTISTKKLPQQNCLPKKYQEIFSDKRFWREVSTKKFLKRH